MADASSARNNLVRDVVHANEESSRDDEWGAVSKEHASRARAVVRTRAVQKRGTRAQKDMREWSSRTDGQVESQRHRQHTDNRERQNAEYGNGPCKGSQGACGPQSTQRLRKNFNRGASERQKVRVGCVCGGLDNRTVNSEAALAQNASACRSDARTFSLTSNFEKSCSFGFSLLRPTPGTRLYKEELFHESDHLLLCIQYTMNQIQKTQQNVRLEMVQ